jgi:hypothetical protein
MPIVWGVAPPPRLPRSFIRLLVVRAGESVILARLGPVVGLLTHWAAPRTIACVGAETCPVHHLPLTWKGYVPCVAAIGKAGNGGPAWKLAVGVVTPEVAKEMDACSVGSPLSLRRAGKRANAPLTIEGTKMPGPAPIPESFDVRPYVLRAMGYPQDFSGLRIASA